MNNDSSPANVGSNDGLGVLVERLRACLPLASDGADHKTWCSVLGSDLREAVAMLGKFAPAVGELPRYVTQCFGCEGRSALTANPVFER